MNWLLKNHQRDFGSVRSDDKNCKRRPQITGNKAQNNGCTNINNGAEYPVVLQKDEILIHKSRKCGIGSEKSFGK